MWSRRAHKLISNVELYQLKQETEGTKCSLSGEGREDSMWRGGKYKIS